MTALDRLLASGFSEAEARMLAENYPEHVEYALELRPLAHRVIVAAIVDRYAWHALYGPGRGDSREYLTAS